MKKISLLLLLLISSSSLAFCKNDEKVQEKKSPTKYIVDHVKDHWFFYSVITGGIIFGKKFWYRYGWVTKQEFQQAKNQILERMNKDTNLIVRTIKKTEKNLLNNVNDNQIRTVLEIKSNLALYNQLVQEYINSELNRAKEDVNYQINLSEENIQKYISNKLDNTNALNSEQFKALHSKIDDSVANLMQEMKKNTELLAHLTAATASPDSDLGILKKINLSKLFR